MMSDIQIVMIIYTIEGAFIGVITTPLMLLILLKKSNRDRKEFLLIAFVAIVDFIYVVVNVINSVFRMYLPLEMISLHECLAEPQFFISLIVTQLVAGMPLMVACDRLVASFCPVWYYKQSAVYTMSICIPPVILGILVTSLNSWIVNTDAASNIQVIATCFTSSLPAQKFKLTFHLTKWICILLAAVVYALVAIILHDKHFRSRYMNKRLGTANRVMGFTTINSLIFHLFPDVQLAYPFLGANTIIMQCILYSMILDKIFFNFVSFMIFHKELRQMYTSMFLSKVKSNSGSGTNQSRMFSVRC